MRVEMLNVGWFTSAAGIWRQGDEMDRRVRFPVPAYVVETGEERILVDTGLCPEAIADPAAHYGVEMLSMFEFEQEQRLEEQLDLATLTKVVITHLHFDHAGGLAQLPPRLPIYVQQREWVAAHDVPAAERNFFLASDYATVAEQVRIVSGDHDLLGDGSVELLSTPGHTPGHQSVRIGGDLIVGADVSHYASGLDDHRFPVFADDHAAQKASAERLRALRDSGAKVTPGHDPELLVPGPIVQS